MTEGRWDQARSDFLAARGDLEASQSVYLVGLLNTFVGARAAGRFPEAADATEAAEEFFRSVGAESFLTRYRAAVVADAVGPTRKPATSTTEVAAS